MTFLNELREVGGGIASHVRAGVASARRTTAAMLGLRLTVLGSLLVASALVFPADFLLSRWFYVLAATALVAALWPRGAVVGFAIGILVTLYAVLTWAGEGTPPLWRVALLGAALYLAHAAAALAAVLPHDTAIAGAALGRWTLRVATVLASALGLGLVGMVVVGELAVTPTVLAPVAGTLVAAGLAGLLAWLARRRP